LLRLVEVDGIFLLRRGLYIVAHVPHQRDEGARRCGAGFARRWWRGLSRVVPEVTKRVIATGRFAQRARDGKTGLELLLTFLSVERIRFRQIRAPHQCARVVTQERFEK